jgi:hypothetical protein
MWCDEIREVVWLTALVAGLSLLSVGIAVASWQCELGGAVFEARCV